MRPLLPLVLALMAIAVWIRTAQPGATPASTLTVAGGFGPLIQRSLELRHQPMTVEPRLVRLDVSNREQTLKNLLGPYWALRTRLDVLRQNISQCGYRNPITDQPYLRRWVQISDRGDVTGVVEDDSCRYRYDPSNPQAIKTGALRGYVRMTNVNICREQFDMARCQEQLALLEDVMHRIDPHVVIGMPPACPAANHVRESSQFETFLRQDSHASRPPHSCKDV